MTPYNWKPHLIDLTPFPQVSDAPPQIDEKIRKYEMTSPKLVSDLPQLLVTGLC